jgi:hypothetical protein
MAEHAATTAATTTAAHFVPVGEEIATMASMAAAEHSGMAFVMAAIVPAFAVSESVTVVMVVQGVEKQIAHTHGEFRYIVRVS